MQGTIQVLGFTFYLYLSVSVTKFYILFLFGISLNSIESAAEKKLVAVEITVAENLQPHNETSVLLQTFKDSNNNWFAH